MNLPVSLTLALKYLRPRRSFLSLVTVISTLGVVLGVAVMIVVLGIMTGFGEMWRTRLMEFHAHLTVQASDPVFLNDIGEPRIVDRITDTIDGVKAVSPAVFTKVMLEHNGAMAAPYIKGIDPEREKKTSVLHRKLLGDTTLDLYEDEIIIGEQIARNLGVVEGDTVLAYSPRSLEEEDDTVRLPEELVVVGIFRFGMVLIDNEFAVTDLDTARKLAGFEEGLSGLVVQIDKPNTAREKGAMLNAELPLSFRTHNWIDDNSETFTALQVEKSMMYFILSFVSLVAAFCVVCTLITTTVQKTPDIGLMKSLGFSRLNIGGVFLTMGFLQGLVGSALGVGAGLLILRFRGAIMDFINHTFNVEVFPLAVYGLDQLPASISRGEVLTIAGIALGLCILSGGLAALRALHLRPIDALRHE